ARSRSAGRRATAIVLAVGSASLAGILVLGLWRRGLDAKVQRVSDRLAREAARAAARPVPAPCRIDAVAPRLERLETAVARIGDTTAHLDRKSTRLNSSHVKISYAVFCLKKKKRHR